jgi:hypothetical protein
MSPKKRRLIGQRKKKARIKRRVEAAKKASSAKPTPSKKKG